MKSATAGTAGRRRFRRGVAMPATCSSTTAGSIRRIAATVRTVFRCVASRNRCRWTLQPGLTAEKKRVAVVQLDARLQTINRESSALRPPLLRLCKTPVGVPSGTAKDGDLKVAIVPAQNSISCLPPRTAVSKRRTADAILGGRPVPLGTRTRRPRGSDAPSGPDPLGENQSLSSPPLEPRGLLLSVMRQKVGKERIQGDCHPLGHPPRCYPNLAELTPVCECQRHPRASTTAGIERLKTVQENCMPSVTTGAVGRRLGQALMPLLGLQLRLSRPTGQQNARWARCGTSRSTQRVFYWGSLSLISNRT